MTDRMSPDSVQYWKDKLFACELELKQARDAVAQAAPCPKCDGEGYINRHANLPDEPCPACAQPQAACVTGDEPRQMAKNDFIRLGISSFKEHELREIVAVFCKLPGIAPAEPQGAWRPIETAPQTEWGKTNRAILWSDKLGGVCVGEVGNFNGNLWANVGSYHGNAIEHWGVTHWMPANSLSRPVCP